MPTAPTTQTRLCVDEPGSCLVGKGFHFASQTLNPARASAARRSVLPRPLHEGLGDEQLCTPADILRDASLHYFLLSAGGGVA